MLSEDGPFGIGTTHNYGHLLDAGTSRGLVINFVLPDLARAPFVQGSDGKYRNSTWPSMIGVEMTLTSSDQIEVRWKDGTVWGFTALGPNLSYLDSIADPNGNTTTLIRDVGRPLQQITEIVDPVGRKLFIAYNENDHITSITDPSGRKVSYSYNDNNTLARVTDTEGGVTRYEYDSSWRLRKVIDPRGVVVAENVYGLGNRVVEQFHANGGSTKIKFMPGNVGFGSIGLPVFSNSVSILSHDEPPSGGGIPPPPPPVREPEWHVEDPLGRVTKFRFDPVGNLLKAVDPLGQVTTFGRSNQAGLVRSVTGKASCSVCGDPAGGDMFYTYDGAGNEITRSDLLGNVTSYTYDPVLHKVAAITNPLEQVREFRYDDRGNLTEIIDENHLSTRFEYDDHGQMVKLIDPADMETTFEYDGFGNLVSTTDPLGDITRFRYDQISRLIETTDALGNSTRLVYDKLDRVVEQIDAHGNSTRFAYDGVGNLLVVTDARDNTVSFTYDEMNRVVSRTDAVGKTEHFEYDLAGNLIKHTDRRGIVSTFEYDELNRLTLETYDDGSTVRRFYDQRGRLTRVLDSESGEFLRSYDNVGRTKSATTPFGMISYEYDKAGQVLRRQVTGQAPVDYTYDPVGNMLSASMPGAGVTLSYDTRDLIERLIRSNGVSSTYSYDEAGQLTDLIHSRGETILDSQTYGYDAIGNRITHATDLAQPLITQPDVHSYDNANRILDGIDENFTHDANGNLTSRTTAEGTTTYSWDVRNRLVAISSPSGETIGLTYDFEGNLLRRSVFGGGEDFDERFVLDDITNVAYMDTTLGDSLSFISGQSIDQHFGARLGNGSGEFALTNAINSTTGITNANGALIETIQYEPFGETSGAGTSTFPFGFTGRNVASGNLYYYRARFYESLTGRFISEDPLGLNGDDDNYYRYVSNNPLGFIDPKGLQAVGHAGGVTGPLPPPPQGNNPHGLKGHLGTPYVLCGNFKPPQSPCKTICDECRRAKGKIYKKAVCTACVVCAIISALLPGGPTQPP